MMLTNNFPYLSLSRSAIAAPQYEPLSANTKKSLFVRRERETSEGNGLLNKRGHRGGELSKERDNMKEDGWKKRYCFCAFTAAITADGPTAIIPACTDMTACTTEG